MKVVGIIVNYRTPELTAKAVTALLSELAQVEPAHVYVVDNDSGDGSYAFLSQEHAARGWGDSVSVLAAPRNGGYGYGINRAVEQALARPEPPDYLYVLNSDAFVDPGSLTKLVAFMDAHPQAGLGGSVVHGADGVLQGAAFRFPCAWSELDDTAGIGRLSKLLRQHAVALPLPPDSQVVDWVPGTGMLIRRQVFEQVGLFDEAFFLYYEEIDFCRRLGRAGWQCCFIADAPITHIGCVSTGMLDQSRPMPKYWFDSRHRYFLKHHGWTYAVLCDTAWLAGFALNIMKNTLLRRSTARRPHMLRDFIKSSVRDLVGPGHGAEPSPLAPSDLRRDERTADDLTLFEILREDFATFDRDPLEPGLWAVVAHRIGVRAHSSQFPLRTLLEGGYRLMFTGVDWVWGIHLPRSVQLGRRVRLWHSGCMLLTARSIGNDVHIRHATTFGPVRGGGDAGPLPVIEDGADIGSGVCVLGGVTVGRDAMIGANSVVMKNVPPRATVLGVPARIIPL